MIRYAGLTDRGRVRPNNEDHWFADAGSGVFIVSDGMGAQLAGELASRIVVELLPKRLRRTLATINDLRSQDAADKIADVVASLSEDVRKESEGQPGVEGMGATLVLAIVREMCAVVVHLGDSRAYLLRGKRFEQLTKDHSVVQYLVEADEVSGDQASFHPAANRLSRYVGMEGKANPETRRLDLRSGDRLLLCSDGLTNMQDDRRLCEILMSQEHPEECCQHLIRAANDAGGNDNVTAVVVAPASINEPVPFSSRFLPRLG